MNIGSRLKAFRKRVELTQSTLAEILGITQSAVAAYEKDKRPFPLESAQIIAERYHINLNWLLTGEGEMFLAIVSSTPVSEKTTTPPQAQYDLKGRECVVREENLVELPIEGVIAAGPPIANTGDEDLGVVRVSVTDPQNYVALLVEGNSMTPQVLPGDVVLIRREMSWRVCEGRVCAVVADHELTLKRMNLDVTKSMVVLTPFNSHCSPIVFNTESTDMQLVGYLSYLIRKY